MGQSPLPTETEAQQSRNSRKRKFSNIASNTTNIKLQLDPPSRPHQQTAMLNVPQRLLSVFNFFFSLPGKLLGETGVKPVITPENPPADTLLGTTPLDVDSSTSSRIPSQPDEQRQSIAPGLRAVYAPDGLEFQSPTVAQPILKKPRLTVHPRQMLQETLRKRDKRIQFPLLNVSTRSVAEKRGEFNRSRSSQRVDSPFARIHLPPNGRPKIEDARRVELRRWRKVQGSPLQLAKIAKAKEQAREDRLSLDALIKSLVQNKSEGFSSYAAVEKQREDRNKEIERLKKEALVRRDHDGPVKQLTAETLQKVEGLLSSSRKNANHELITKFRQTICIKDILTLRDQTWLNDEVVNFYLNMVCDRANAQDFINKKVFAFNSFFYDKLSEQGYNGVARWAKRAKIDGDNLLKLDYLIVPVHLQSHWTLGVVNFKRKRLEYYDSLGGRGDRFYAYMRSYLQQETRNKLNLNEWIDYSMKGAPMQNNGNDCGVFLCKTAEVVCRGTIPVFTPHDIPLVRRRMVAEILEGKLGVE